LIEDNVAKIIPEEKTKEAKFQRDKFVLETGQNREIDKRSAKKLLNIEPENYERIIYKKYKLKEVHNTYKKYLHIEETDRIDIILATTLSNRLDGIPIWLMLVGNSGDMKSVQLNALEGFDTYYLQKLTSKTLVNGFPNKTKYPDLAPKLNGKLVIIRDMATLMKLPPSEKAEIWGQLRDLYDGFAGTTSGMGTDVQYKDIKVSLIGASTPAIDSQILIHQDLGTRELIYRLEGNKKQRELMDKCMENESIEEEIKLRLNEVTLGFLNNREIKRIKLNDEEMYELREMALYISFMRASADIDGYTNTLINDVHPEAPTRIIKQLKRLFISLKNLEENYKTKDAMRILWKISKSSAFQMRVKVLDLLLEIGNEEISTSKVAERLKIGKGTAQRQLNVLWNMNFIECRKDPTTYPDKTYDYWKLNKGDKNLNKLLETVRAYNI